MKSAGLLWAMFVVGGCAYLVGWKDWNPAWFLLALVLVSGIEL